MCDIQQVRISKHKVSSQPKVSSGNHLLPRFRWHAKNPSKIPSKNPTKIQMDGWTDGRTKKNAGKTSDGVNSTGTQIRYAK